MAHLEVDVQEVVVSEADAAANPQTSGLLLADILARTGGQYVWDFPVPEQLRMSWTRTAAEIDDQALGELAQSPSVRVALGSFRGRKTLTTRVTIGFTLHFAPDEGLRAARAEAERS